MRIRPIPVLRLFCGPTQADADGLIQRRYEAALARNPTAMRAAQKMARWHAEPRWDGAGTVVQWRGRRVR